MKRLIILAVVISISFAVPQRSKPTNQDYQPDEFEEPQNNRQSPQDKNFRTTTYIPILKFSKEQGNDGSYKSEWETGNNIYAEEQGFLKSLGPDPDEDGATLNAQVQQGSYEYTAPNGEIIKVQYIADENGFHASGDHLPTPPPVSPEVQKGLDIIFAGIKAQQEADARGDIRDDAKNQYNN